MQLGQRHRSGEQLTIQLPRTQSGLYTLPAAPLTMCTVPWLSSSAQVQLPIIPQLRSYACTSVPEITNTLVTAVAPKDDTVPGLKEDEHQRRGS